MDIEKLLIFEGWNLQYLGLAPNILSVLHIDVLSDLEIGFPWVNKRKKDKNSFSVNK